MKTKQKTKVVVMMLALAALVAFVSTAGAGTLEPSAPPASTMKTLDEVEPRIPIPASASPAATFTISQSGSYYLTGDRNASGTAITVNVNDVTVDLAGYSLIGGSNYGIYMNGRSNVEIRNGTVRNFGTGIYENSYTDGKGHRVIAVRALGMVATHGILLRGDGHLVKDCTAVGNASIGIAATYGSTVTGNTCYDNGLQGIWAGLGCTVTGNTCYDNENHGIIATYGSTVTGNTCYSNHYHGIEVVSGCTVIGNTVYDNNDCGIRASGYGHTITGNTVYDNNDCGIYATYGSTVTGNTVRNNNQDDTAGYAGIRVYSDCLVKGNTATSNKKNNIYADYNDNCIEENLVTDSAGNGICFWVTGNFYANNRASGNTYDYNDVPGTNTDGGGNVSF